MHSIYLNIKIIYINKIYEKFLTEIFAILRPKAYSVSTISDLDLKRKRMSTQTSSAHGIVA